MKHWAFWLTKCPTFQSTKGSENMRLKSYNLFLRFWCVCIFEVFRKLWYRGSCITSKVESTMLFLANNWLTCADSKETLPRTPLRVCLPPSLALILLQKVRDSKRKIEWLKFDFWCVCLLINHLGPMNLFKSFLGINLQLISFCLRQN